MTAQSSLTAKEFTGVRVEAATPLPFDEVLKRLRNLVGYASASDIVAAAKDAASEADYAREVEKRFIGESGFTLFFGNRSRELDPDLRPAAQGGAMGLRKSPDRHHDAPP